MKTIKKRILALWMAVCMALTMMPSMAIPVLAAGLGTSENVQSITIGDKSVGTLSGTAESATTPDSPLTGTVELDEYSGAKLKVKLAEGKSISSGGAMKYFVGQTCSAEQLSESQGTTLDNDAMSGDLGLSKDKFIWIYVEPDSGSAEYIKITVTLKKTETPAFSSNEATCTDETNKKAEFTLSNAEKFNSKSAKFKVYDVGGSADQSATITADYDDNGKLTLNNSVGWSGQDNKYTVKATIGDHPESEASSQITVKEKVKEGPQEPAKLTVTAAKTEPAKKDTVKLTVSNDFGESYYYKVLGEILENAEKKKDADFAENERGYTKVDGDITGDGIEVEAEDGSFIEVYGVTSNKVVSWGISEATEDAYVEKPVFTSTEVTAKTTENKVFELTSSIDLSEKEYKMYNNVSAGSAVEGNVVAEGKTLTITLNEALTSDPSRKKIYIAAFDGENESERTEVTLKYLYETGAAITKVTDDGGLFEAIEVEKEGSSTFSGATEIPITVPYDKVGKSSDAKVKLELSAKATAQYAAEDVDASTKIKEDYTEAEGTGISVNVTDAKGAVIYVKVTDESGENTRYYKLVLTMNAASRETAIETMKVEDASGKTTDIQPVVPAEGGSEASPKALTAVIPYTQAGSIAKVTLKVSDGATATWGKTDAKTANETITEGNFTTDNIEYQKAENNGITVYIKVVAEDESTTTYYALTITMKKPSDTTDVESITLNDYVAEVADDADAKEFDGSKPDKALQYSVSVPNNFTSGKLVVNVKEDVQTVQYKTEDPSTVWSGGTQMNNGEGTAITADTVEPSEDYIWLEVKAQNPETPAVYYKITINKVDVKVGSKTAITADDGGYTDTFKTTDALTTTTLECDDVDTFLEQKSVELATEHPEIYGSDAAKNAFNDIVGDGAATSVEVRIVETIDIAVKNYNSTEKHEELKVDIAPAYKIVAINQTQAGQTDITLLNENTDYIVLPGGAPLETEGKAVTVTVPVPFVANNDYVKIVHVHDGVTYTDQVKVTEEKKVTFTNTHGFSEFTITKATDALLTNLTVSEGTLVPAFDPMIKDYTVSVANDIENITINATVASELIVRMDKAETATTTQNNHPFELDEGQNKFAIEASGGSMTATTYFITVIRQEAGQEPPSGGDTPGTTPGGSTTPQPDNTVNMTSPVNGYFDVSDTNAKAGDTVTVTPKPNDGYELDKVTVTDKNGNAVEVKDNGDGTYSFVMPEDAAQPVTVNVTFKESEGGEVTPPTADALVFSSASQEKAIENRITTNADTALKLKAADEGVNIGSLADWTVESDDEAVVKVLEPSNKLRYMGAGTAHVTVTAKGDNDKVYSIVITINVKPGTPTFTLSHVSSKKARTFTVTTSTVRGATGFQVKYSLKKSLKSSKTKTYACGKKLIRQTIKANKTKRTYYVRVRAYQTVDGERVYGAWSKLTKTIKSK